ncbi:MAG: DUF6916 family protein [Thermoanaerobaculia bacterium]
MLEDLTFDQMNQYVGSTFRAETAGRTIDLKLISAAKVMESEAARLRRTPFSLYFSGSGELFLPQSIYRLRHEAFSEPLDIFLVPIKREGDGVIYEAVFT